jgi:enoyl-CoA hydratase
MTSSTQGHVSKEQRGAIMLIGLDRASKRNAFDIHMLDELSLAYGDFERNEQARVAVVFAHGEHFTGGLDLALPSRMAGRCLRVAMTHGASELARGSANR